MKLILAVREHCIYTLQLRCFSGDDSAHPEKCLIFAGLYLFMLKVCLAANFCILKTHKFLYPSQFAIRGKSQLLLVFEIENQILIILEVLRGSV